MKKIRMFWIILFDDFELVNWMYSFNIKCLRNGNTPIDEYFIEENRQRID